MTAVPWRQNALTPTTIPVGPCAWRIGMCNPIDASYLHEHPSLLVATADDDRDRLSDAAPVLRRLRDRHPQRLPLLLGVHEPPFVRRLAGTVRERIGALGVDRVDVLTLRVDQVEDLKSGGVLQTLFELRDAGLTQHVGIAHHDARAIEWLATNTAVQLLAFPYHLADQSAGYRALATAREHGMACVALQPADPTPDQIAFALGQSRLALPVLDAPIPDGTTPMTVDQTANAWDDFRKDHAEPPPLPRGRPPQT